MELQANGRSLMAVLTIFLAVLVSTTVSFADETTEDVDGILVENAQIIRIQSDENRAQLKFSVSNFGTNDVTLVGLSSEVAGGIEMYFFSSDGTKQMVTDLTVLQEETLNLASSHIKIDLVDVKRELNPGMKVEFKLNFRGFHSLAMADVH